MITSDGVALATAANGGKDLITYDANTKQETAHSFASSLPNAVGGFDDVAVDPNARAGDSTVAFAIDAGSGIVCSCKFFPNALFSLRSQQFRLRYLMSTFVLRS